MQRRPLVAGNWKMNGDLALLEQMGQALAEVDLDFVDVMLCPPFPFLAAAAQQSFMLGGQNISEFDSGAHTGEVSASMLSSVGCQYVLVGHSERRSNHHESNALVADKVAKALAFGLTPVFCCGEPLQIRQSGELYPFLSAQLDAVVSCVGIDAMREVIIAYEPVWAIGTGETASPEQAQEVHEFLRGRLAEVNKEIASGVRILYGGSVNGSNAQALFSQPDIDGGLIGGASLKPEEFLSICHAAKVKV